MSLLSDGVRLLSLPLLPCDEALSPPLLLLPLLELPEPLDEPASMPPDVFVAGLLGPSLS